MNLIKFSLKKSKILSRIANESKPSSKGFDAKELFEQAIKERVKGKQPTKRDIYIQDLLVLLGKDKKTIELLEHHGRTMNDIKKIISVLEASGAGQIIKGHYVAISSIAYLGQLRVILKHWDGENFRIEDLDTYNSNLKMCFYLIQSFE